MNALKRRSGRKFSKLFIVVSAKEGLGAEKDYQRHTLSSFSIFILIERIYLYIVNALKFKIKKGLRIKDQ